MGRTVIYYQRQISLCPISYVLHLSVDWKVNYTGVNNAGTTVQIRFDWDDGTVNTENTIKTGPGAFETIANHTYVSTGDKCNYRPKATLVVNGVVCSSSTQEQIVTVWDNDDHNGGHMHISPTVYPICFGNSANVRFRDLTSLIVCLRRKMMYQICIPDGYNGYMAQI